MIMRRRIPKRAARVLAAVVAAVCVHANTLYAADPEMSEANSLLFESRHLDGLQSPVTLHYRLNASGRESGEAFTDEIAMDVRPNTEGRDWHVEFDYLSGGRHRPVPPVSAATGNPIIKIFLQRQVIEMERRIGGNWRYFQKSIKSALADSADVTTIRFPYNGRTVEGRRIRIVPFRNDPRSEQIGMYSTMRYTIVMSDAVPGDIYELTATTSASASSSDPAFAETVRLHRVEPPSAR